MRSALAECSGPREAKPVTCVGLVVQVLELHRRPELQATDRCSGNTIVSLFPFFSYLLFNSKVKSFAPPTSTSASKPELAGMV